VLPAPFRCAPHVAGAGGDGRGEGAMRSGRPAGRALRAGADHRAPVACGAIRPTPPLPGSSRASTWKPDSPTKKRLHSTFTPARGITPAGAPGYTAGDTVRTPPYTGTAHPLLHRCRLLAPGYTAATPHRLLARMYTGLHRVPGRGWGIGSGGLPVMTGADLKFAKGCTKCRPIASPPGPAIAPTPGCPGAVAPIAPRATGRGWG
jgi:hypothetical protein